MSAPGTHGVGDIWPGILNKWRCQSVDDGRRCQLYLDHDDAHAHAAGMPTQKLPIYRWNDDGRRWTVQEARLRWCCMFAT